MLSIALVSLAAQYPLGAARFILFDGAPPGQPQREFLDRTIPNIPHPIRLGSQSDLADILNSLGDEMKMRADGESADSPVTFVFFHGLQRYGKLRQDDGFSFSADDAATSPGARLDLLIREGPGLGFHVVVTCDTGNNVSRFLTRKALSEFEMRVLFQMSANDSAGLIDSARASTLGLHRALFHHEQQGSLEVFRPYALPDREWLEKAARNLRRLLQ
jgi:S-DNA-T family DNA segregation ATPase FtsK/SpoIIIE